MSNVFWIALIVVGGCCAVIAVGLNLATIFMLVREDWRNRDWRR